MTEGLVVAGRTALIAARTLGAAAALLVATAEPTAGQVKAEIYFPPDRALVAKRYLPVEGRVSTPAADDLEIVVNEQDAYRTRVRRFMFSEEVSLREGENTIQVGGTVRRVYYAADAKASAAGYARVYGHIGLGEGCEECHAVGEDGTFSLAGPREELCSWCHNDVVVGPRGKHFASVHAPVKAGECLGCHVAHTSPNPELLREKVPTCRDCHAPVFERLKTDRFVHGPLNLGDCRLCHAIHGSTEPGLLNRPATSLCTDCHSEVLPPEGTPAALAPHRMIPEGQCAKCHFPHSSPNQHLMRLSAGRLCQECHPDNTRSFHEAKGFSIYICSKCHALHRPAMPHLIIDASRSLCTECHTPSEKPASAHKAAHEGRCFVCHAFHDTSLASDIATVCLRCHDPNAALLASHSGVAFEKSRCTSCHLPHESSLEKLLLPVAHTPFARRECGGCHRPGEGATRQPLKEGCLKCHTGLDVMPGRPAPAALHKPFAEADCALCHASHAARAKGLLNEPPIRLCLQCHRDLRKATVLRPTSSHGAFLEGRCPECHAPHFSGNPGLLREPAAVLCLGCHPAVTGPPGQPWRVPHPPVAEGRCDSCHRSHSSALPALLRSPAQRGCRSCHAEFYAAFESATNVSRHAPVREENCPSCHQLHGSSSGALLKPGATRDGCQGCHADWKNFHHLYTPEQLAEKNGGQLAPQSGCLHCHRPHASTERKLLLPMNSRVCVRCHGK